MGQTHIVFYYYVPLLLSRISCKMKRFVHLTSYSVSWLWIKCVKYEVVWLCRVHMVVLFLTCINLWQTAAQKPVQASAETTAPGPAPLSAERAPAQRPSATGLTVKLLKTRGLAGLYRGAGATLMRLCTFKLYSCYKFKKQNNYLHWLISPLHKATTCHQCSN